MSENIDRLSGVGFVGESVVATGTTMESANKSEPVFEEEKEGNL